MSSAIERAFFILECFGKHQKPLRLADVVDELELPKQTAHRLIRQLESMELLERDIQPGKFRLGTRMRTLGIASILSQNQTVFTRAILEDLKNRFEETVNIGVLDKGEVLYIDRVECHWPLRVQLSPGSKVKAHCTAIGKLLLAHLPESQFAVTLRNITLEQYTPNTITDPAALKAECSKIREQGYSENIGEDLQGLVALAVPVYGHSGQVIAGIAVHAPEARMSLATMHTHLAALVDAADRLGLALTAGNT
ncbi:IclR family transcriptional regulator [Marinobacter sp. F3R08]|uniref:IclR family transcriptional regulator n=1 Tax=Marinobacter sp. F3R08 TaxID=2841559 RepID=UPI001C083392|nr:IclR family transcriptional regulator [Marinobacter sp. F3R08]MBU2953916.1 IclR family transcriptional regulator [Marinobacter sp. F3R08]